MKGKETGRFLQPTWTYLLHEYGDFMRSPLFPVVLFVSFYFVCNIPYTIFDLYSMKSPKGFRKNKIQRNQEITPELMWKAVYTNLYNNIVYVLPAGIYQWIYRPPELLPEEAPELLSVLLGVIGSILLFDFQYYWWHVLHHKNRWLYKYVHKIHHEYTSPFSWVTQHLSPLEMFTTGVLSCVNPIILNQHFITGTLCIMLNIHISVEVHSGYEFPWNLHYWMPVYIYAGPGKHDMHHKQPKTNFEPFFSHWDKIFGTDTELCHSQSYLQHVKDGKKSD